MPDKETEIEAMPDQMKEDFIEVFEDLLCALYLAHGVMIDPAAVNNDKREQIIDGVGERIDMLQKLLQVEDVPTLIRERLLLSLTTKGMH